MWNIFKSKQNLQQEERNNEEDAEQVIKQLKAKFEQKMKVLVQNIKQSESFFQIYSRITPKEQELASTFEEIITTLEGLTSIIEELRKEISQTQDQLDELRKARDMVANHHSIVSNLQQNYSEQIRSIYSEQEKYVQSLKNEKQELAHRVSQCELLNAETKQKLAKCHEINIGLEIDNHQLRIQNTNLFRQVQEMTLKYSKYAEGSNDTKRMINLQSIKLQYLFYYGRMREGVTNFLSIKDFHELKRVNKYFKYSLQKQECKFLYSSLKIYYQQRQLKEAVNLKYYEKVMELFPTQNIKLNAIKYLHFRIKPATYILPYLQEEVEVLEQKQESEAKERGKFNWRGLFTSEKIKKEETKFSLSQLKNEQQFKKIESKLEMSFKSILSMNLPEDLVYFSETMERQLNELKQNLGHKGQKGSSQLAWTAQLHCLCRFMYLQMNELYNLLQVIFGELVVKSRKLINVQESLDELRENEKVLRNLIENISRDKGNLQKKFMVVENEILKRNLEKDTLLNSFEQISMQSSQIKLKYQNLLHENNTFRLTIEKLQDDRRAFDQNFSKIRKQLQNLQGLPTKCRKMSEMSMSSEGTVKD